MTEHMWSDMLLNICNLAVFVNHFPYRLIRQVISDTVYKEVTA